MDIEQRVRDGDRVAVFGRASGTVDGNRGMVLENRICMPAAWKALVQDGKISLWQVYADWTRGWQVIEEDRSAAGKGPRTASEEQTRGDAVGVEVVRADYLDETHIVDIPKLLDRYASGKMGGGKPLAPETKENLVKELAKLPHAFSVLAYVDGKAAGLVNSFFAFSTFSCRPLVNIHDIVVLEQFRGRGLSQRMLEKVEEIARENGCCKLTLEVLSRNDVALAAYRKFGFSSYELDAEAGVALFWQKELRSD